MSWNDSPTTRERESVPLPDYIRGIFVPLSRLSHDWEMHSAVLLSPAEERTMVREPAQAVPAPVAQRLGKVRVLVVPYVSCSGAGDLVCFSKPRGETHSSVWLEADERIHLILPCRELDAHDTGFEFLASIAELLHPRLEAQELERYSQLVEEELQAGVPGEIDEDAVAAKQPVLKSRTSHRRGRSPFERYRDVSFVSTMAEYMHGLWHDVQIRVGPEHLPLPQLRRRMTLLAEMFPPNAGYNVFADDLAREDDEQPS
ncbi:MAG TPA: hypothetical protein VG204_16335 [Terriglobia bacterium]|nr:hypothetical protein [Terriglobia bacterium]